MLVVNLWGAPGSGKSTTAAGLFFLMKINKFKVELVTEYAKDLVWDRHETMLGNQLSIFSEQNWRLHRLLDHGVDFVITDSPLILSTFYKPPHYLDSFDKTVQETFETYNNLNYFLERVGSFEKIGRRHNEGESASISKSMRDLMERFKIPFTSFEATPHTPEWIFKDILERQPPTLSMPLPLTEKP